MAIDFPNTPSDGQVYFDNVSGIRYVYDATGGIWLARSNSFYSSVETGQVIFDNADVTGGSNGLYFSTSANTLYANSINVATDMRVRGNLYIGTNTVTITDSAIMAQTFYIMDNGTPLAVPTGTAANASYAVANAAFGHTNTTLTHSQAVYAAVNSAFGAVNSAYDTANSKVSKSGDTITGTLSIVGDLIVSGNTRQINANTMSVSDPLIYLAANNYASDIVDIGFIANYVNTGGANVHTGLYREHENKEYYLFQGYDREPINNHIGAMSNNMTLSVLNADIRTSNLNLGGANAITWISSGYGVANAAFGKANSAFQNGAAIFAGSTRFVAGNTYFDFAPGYYTSAKVGPRPAGDGYSSLEFDPGAGNGSKFDVTTGGLTVYPNTVTGATSTTFDKLGNILNQGSVRSPIFYDSDNTSYYVDPASGATFGGMITGVSNETAAFYSPGTTSTGYNYIMSATNDTGSKLVMFVNGSLRSADGGNNAVTIRNDGGPLNLGNISTLTTLYGSYTYSPRTIYFDGNSGYGINFNGQDNTMHRIYHDAWWLIFKGHGNEGWKFRDHTDTDRVVISGATGQIKIAANPSGWNSAPGLVVGYNGDGYLQTRHIWGKDPYGLTGDTLYLNWMNGSNGVNISNRLDVPIIYDSDNSSYYCDPGGFSNFNRLHINPRNDNYYVGSMNDVNAQADWQSLTNTRGQWTVTQYNGIGSYTNSPANVYAYGSVMSWRTENHSFQLYAAHTGSLAYKTQWNNDNYSGWLYPVVYGRNEATSGIYATIYYDSNDTSYRCDPNGTNVLATIEAGGLGRSSSHCIGSNLSGAIAWNNSQLEIRNTNAGNVGISFHRAGYTSVALYHGAGSELRCSGNLFGDSDIRSPIFYDSNDTGYYCDPNGTTRLNDFIVKGLWADNVLIADLSGSGASTIESTTCFTSGTYRAYEIQFQVVPGTMSAGIYMQFYVGGAWRTAAGDYRTYSAIWNAGGSQGYGPNSYIDIGCGGRIRNYAGLTGFASIVFPSRTDTMPIMTGIAGAWDSTIDGGNKINFTGLLSFNSAISGFRIYASSGTISGYVKVYGRR